MKKLLILFLLLTASASAQFAPFGIWQSGATFDPTSIDTLRLELDATTLTGKLVGDTVGIFTASNGNNAVQLTASRKPIYYPDSVSGGASLLFDGVDDYMDASVVLNSGNATAFFKGIIRRKGSTNPRMLAAAIPGGYDYSGAAGGVFMLDSSGTVSRLASFLGSAWGGSATGAYLATQRITATVAGTASKIHVNGTLGTQKTAAASMQGATYVRIMGGIISGALLEPIPGHVSKILVYSTALTDPQRIQVENYLGP